MEFPFIPMEARRADAPFDSPSHLFQVKWDGVRCTALVAGGSTRLASRRMRDRTQLYPELSGLHRLLRAEQAILDGELVCLHDGKPSFFAIMERELAGPNRVAALTLSRPAAYLVFDLVELNGRDLTGVPLQDRQAELMRALEPAEPVHLVESFPGAQGVALYQAIAGQGLEGVVAKHLASPYVSGGLKTAHWLKIKPRQRVNAVVGGISGEPGRLGALLLGLYADDELRYIGRAGSGVTAAHLAAVRSELRPSPCPFRPPPDLGSLPITWVEPRLVAVVDFAEWTPHLHLRQPTLAGFAEVPPGECRFP